MDNMLCFGSGFIGGIILTSLILYYGFGWVLQDAEPDDVVEDE